MNAEELEAKWQDAAEGTLPDWADILAFDYKDKWEIESDHLSRWTAKDDMMYCFMIFFNPQHDFRGENAITIYMIAGGSTLWKGYYNESHPAYRIARHVLQYALNKQFKGEKDV